MTSRKTTSSAVIIAVIAIIIALAALASPYVSPVGNSAGRTSSPQTREFYVFSAENSFDVIPKGLNHYIFSPSQITVNKGDTVLIHFYNAHNDTHHTFTLPAYGINVDLAPSQNKTFSFVATQAGVFMFTCTIHAPIMRGQLTVLPA